MTTALTQVVDRIGGGPRLGLIFFGVAAVAVIWGFAQWGMEPRYVPIATGLSVERIGDATQRLTEAGIEYRLERAGAMLTVPDRDAARARVALASEGLMGAVDTPGFELFDQPSWGMTDFTQRVNYRRALEGELERTMSRMRGVERARVHLALRERSFLRASEQAAEASVVLSLTDASSVPESVVRGVRSLVASSVENLTPENVTVLDDRGRLLSEDDPDSGVGLTHAQLKVQSQIEQYLETKAQAVVAQIVGAGGSTIRVAADLNFDEIARTVQAVDPNQSALVSEDRAEITPGDEAQGAGSLQTSSAFETTRSVETVSRGGARVERLTVAVVVADRRAESADGVVAFEPRTAAELRQIELLVGNAVGFSAPRGDQISVMSAPVEQAQPEVFTDAEREVDYAGIVMAAQRPFIAFVALTVAFLIALRVLKTLRLAPASPNPGSGTGGLKLEASGDRTDGRSLPQGAPGREAVETAPPPRAELKLQDPEMTAKVLRSWMRDS